MSQPLFPLKAITAPLDCLDLMVAVAVALEPLEVVATAARGAIPTSRVYQLVVLGVVPATQQLVLALRLKEVVA
jgi:hypothetical protein